MQLKIQTPFRCGIAAFSLAFKVSRFKRKCQHGSEGRNVQSKARVVSAVVRTYTGTSRVCDALCARARHFSKTPYVGLLENEMYQRFTWPFVVLAGLLGGMAVGGAVAEENGPGTSASATEDESAEQRKSADEYYEILSLLVDTIDQVERNYVQKLSRRELVEAAIQGILHKLDPYSNYIAPEDISRFRTSVDSQFGGIGIQVTIEDGALKVLSPIVGSPAYRAGMQAGDRIVEIEGETTDGMSMDDAVKKLKGEVDTQVSIRVLSPDDTSARPLTLKREMVHLETVLGDSRGAEDKWQFMLDPDQKIAYIRLTAFSRDTADELKKTLQELKQQGMRGLVLDLRFNPGGLLTSAIDVSDLFLSNGRIVSTSGRNITEKAWDAKADDDFDGFPMAILVNRYSASSSEIVAACLQDHNRAIVVGERTWGKGSVQNVVELEGGKSAIKLTTAGYMRPSGKNIHRFPNASDKDEWGVIPNEGYAVRFSDDEMRDFIARRRERDIIGRKERTTTTILAVNDQTDVANPAELDGDEEPPATSQPQAPSDPSASPSTDDKIADESVDSDGESTSTDKSTKAKTDDVAKDLPASTEKTAKHAKSSDRQLEAALRYIKTKLAE